MQIVPDPVCDLKLISYLREKEDICQYRFEIEPPEFDGDSAILKYHFKISTIGIENSEKIFTSEKLNVEIELKSNHQY